MRCLVGFVDREEECKETQEGNDGENGLVGPMVLYRLGLGFRGGCGEKSLGGSCGSAKARGICHQWARALWK